jgi:hypothetical protein
MPFSILNSRSHRRGYRTQTRFELPYGGISIRPRLASSSDPPRGRLRNLNKIGILIHALTYTYSRLPLKAYPSVDAKRCWNSGFGTSGEVVAEYVWICLARDVRNSSQIFAVVSLSVCLARLYCSRQTFSYLAISRSNDLVF